MVLRHWTNGDLLLGTTRYWEQGVTTNRAPFDRPFFAGRPLGRLPFTSAAAGGAGGDHCAVVLILTLSLGCWTWWQLSKCSMRGINRMQPPSACRQLRESTSGKTCTLHQQAAGARGIHQASRGICSAVMMPTQPTATQSQLGEARRVTDEMLARTHAPMWLQQSHRSQQTIAVASELPTPPHS